ncbi:hypothetical protein HN924_03790 [Candidatus Woesearchaeota archaeon]|nr:hypothetical protein [Candidatus Woesearchaeota archaeon]MBT7402233.1 hypothetical protein [Candidatus Woesearchaeota archaeon]
MSSKPKLVVGNSICKYVLVKYSPKISSSELVKFHYALNGRGKQKGILEKTHSLKLANSVILVPKAYYEQVEAFLYFWKCNVSKKSIAVNLSREDRIKAISRQLVAKRRDISDIILIDSSLISQSRESAPVVCLLTHSKTPQRLAENFQEQVGLPVIYVQADQLFSSKYTKLIDALKQGTSLIAKEKKVTPKTLFVYSTKQLTGSAKVQFHYELKGRGKQKGILEVTHSEFFAKSVIITSSRSSAKIRSFLTKWKCQFEEMEVAESV